MSEHTDLIEKKGFVLNRKEFGKNEYRTWTTYYYTHPKGLSLLFNDSDLIVIVRNDEKRCIFDGRIYLNFVNTEF